MACRYFTSRAYTVEFVKLIDLRMFGHVQPTLRS